MRFMRPMLCVSFFAGLIGLSRACPIPVYQYALEHWRADPYIVASHPGEEPSEEHRDALDYLRGKEGVANFQLRIGEPGEEAGGSEEQPGGRLEVYYPEISGIRRPVWTGELSLENARALVESPARTLLGDALARRATAVFLFLESGDKQIDRRLKARLEKQLKRLEETIVVPESAPWGGVAVAIDHDINFEVVSVARDNRAERMLVRMLLASEPDLETDFAGAPMVFPVFGRGLVLYALVGRGINERTVGEAVRFITGPCSCQVKAANPGIDLLMAVKWDEEVEPMTPPAAPGTAGTGSFLHRLDREAEDAAK